MRTCKSGVAALLIGLAFATELVAADLDQEIVSLIREYDHASYDSADNDARVKAFGALATHAEGVLKQYPNRAEPLVWHGLALAELSAADRNLGLAKQARKTLETAVTISPNPYAVDAYSTLGALFANVPGFPIGFGDKKKAAVNFKNALAINPSSIRANVGYAQLLFKTDDYTGAIKHATVTLNAPPRPGREKADKAARTSAESLIAKAKQKLRT